MKKLLLATLLASTTLPAMAGDAIDIKVIGTISPTACTPTASGGGVVDYGNIKPSTLDATGTTVLPAKTLNFTIQCSGEANVALRASSNRGVAANAGTANSTGASKLTDATTVTNIVSGLPYNITVNNPDVMGLGTSPNGADIGGYMMILPTSLVTLDGVDANRRLFASAPLDQNTTWGVENNEVSHGGSLNSGDTYFSYSTDSAATKPQAFKLLSGTLIVRGYITEKSKLDVTPINLDGSSTIELYYF